MIALYRQLFALLPKGLCTAWWLILPLSLLAASLESANVYLIYQVVQYLRDPATYLFPSWMPLIAETSFNALALLLVVIFIIKNIFLILFWMLRNHLSAKTQSFLSHQLLDNYLHKEYYFHLQNNSSELIRNTVDSVDSVCLLALNGFFTLMNYVLIAIAISVMLIAISPAAGLLVMLVAGSLITLIYLISRAYLKQLSQTTEQEKAQRLKTLTEMFSSMREILLSARQRFWIKHFMQHQNTYVNAYSKGMSITSGTQLVMEVLLIIALMIMVSIFLMGSEQQSQIIFPLLGAYAYAVARLIPIVSGISLNLGMMQFSVQPLKNVLYELQQKKLIKELENIETDQAITIDVNGLNFTYPDKDNPVLKSLAIKINQGDSIAIIGESGSGKSTLMLLLMGLLKASDGQIIVGKKHLNSVVLDWQKRLAYVPQEITLFDDSIKANITFGEVEIDQVHLQKVIQQAHLDDLINSLPHGLETWVGEKGIQLSGGQRQRIAIARALYRQPDFLFLDEATAALDYETEKVIVQTLKELKGQLTIIVIAHRSSTVEHCDQIYVLENGSLRRENDQGLIKNNGAIP